jgi:gliding motility-associated-like protein
MSMKSILFFIFSILMLSSWQPLKAQDIRSETDWEKAKKEGRIDGRSPGPFRTSPSKGKPYKLAENELHVRAANTSCSCWQNRDNSWQVVAFDSSGGNGGPGTAPLYRNDDWSSAAIVLPFTFCLYGHSWNSVYINNNGNVSFGAAYSTFTADTFPSSQFVMVAPFWGDVDTRDSLTPSGVSYFKVTPTHIIIQWDSVGYYDAHADKRNTFQLIMTNGSDPLVPGGNVSFCYKDMQWTTGDQSLGVNGFGGNPAVVGVNNGDGINYIQFGTFNQSGATYNGPFGGGSGVDWLDNQSIVFNACSSTNNIPPTFAGFSLCDTLHLCIGDTLHLNPFFNSPEAGQITHVTINSTGVTGFTVVSTNSGNTASLVSYLVGQVTNAGYNTLTITATDNGTPPASTSVTLVIEVVPGPPPIHAGNDTTICIGTSVTLNATGSASYTWSPAGGLSNPYSANPTTSPSTTMVYTVSVSNGGCTRSDEITVHVQVASALAGPDTTICAGQHVQLYSSGGNSYLWSPATGLSVTNISNPLASPTTTTTYTVTVNASSGCAASGVVTVNIPPSSVVSFNYKPGVIEVDGAYTFQNNAIGAVSTLWYFGDGTTSGLVNPVHVYTSQGTFPVCLVSQSSTGCIDSVCVDVTVLPKAIVAPNIITPNGDGTNDLLVFQNLEYFPGSHLIIYDRWGVKVYENSNYQNSWDGKYMSTGREVTDGTYYYILDGARLPKTFSGFVQVIRGR